MTRPRIPSLATLVLFLAACGTDAPPPASDEVADVDPQAIRPFDIDVPDEVLADLIDRLERTRLPDQIPDTGWSYGTDRGYLEGLLAYWRDGFDWRAQERRLNELDQFHTIVEGIDLHFVHARSPHEGAMPLLLIHGWPGSFIEFAKLVEPLTRPETVGGDPADAFHVVVPSLPGYGFSERPTESGFNPERMADLLASLMDKLEYDRYGVQGGDWGSIIGRSLAGNYPAQVIGYHTNMVFAGPPRDGDPNEGVTPEELAFQRERTEAFSNGRGYQEIQGTKPQTLGYALNDSPAGLAAWIVEKFHGWTDNDGTPEDAINRDAILTNITLYWVTGTATSSARIYYESRYTPASSPVRYVEVPTGAAVFPKEIYVAPRAWAEVSHNIVHWTVMPRGGHFAALEEPDLLMEDVRDFFRELR